MASAQCFADTVLCALQSCVGLFASGAVGASYCTKPTVFVGFCLWAVTLAAAGGHQCSHIPPPRYLVTTHPHKKKQLILQQLPSYALLGHLARRSFIRASLHMPSFPSWPTVKQNPVCDVLPLALWLNLMDSDDSNFEGGGMRRSQQLCPI